MIVVSVRLRNVRCYADSGDLTFAAGVNVISGRNGSGKSTILEAIGYAVFGALPRGGVKEFKRKNTAGQALIDVEIRGRDGLPYTIRRALNGSAVWRSQDGGTVDEALRNDILGIPPGKDRAAFFQDVVGVKQNEFLDPFLASLAERKRIFEQLFGIADYERAFRDLAPVETALETESVSEERSAKDERTALDDPATGEPAAVLLLAAARERAASAETERRAAELARKTALEAVRRREALRADADAARKSAEALRQLGDQARAGARALQAERDRALADRKRVEETREAKLAYDRAEEKKRALESERTSRDLAERRSQEALRSLSEATVERATSASEAERAARTLELERAENEKRRAAAKRAHEKHTREQGEAAQALASFEALDCEPGLTNAARALAQVRKLLKGRLARAKRAEDEAARLLSERKKLELDLPLAAGREEADAVRERALARAAEAKAREDSARRNLELYESGRGMCPIFQVHCDTVKSGARERLRADLRAAEAASLAAAKALDEAGRALVAANDAAARVARLPALAEQREAARLTARAAREEAASDPEIASALEAHVRALRAAAEVGIATASPQPKVAKPGAARARRGGEASPDDGLACDPLSEESLAGASEALEALARRFAERRSSLEETLARAKAALELARADEASVSREDARLARVAGQLEGLRAKISRLDARIAKLEAARSEAERALAPFADLAERLSAIETLLERNRASRDEHHSKLENAARAPGLAKDADAAEEHAESLAHALALAERRAGEAVALVDPIAESAARVEHERRSAQHDAAQARMGRAETEHEAAEKLVRELARRRERLLEKEALCARIARERAVLHSSRQVLKSAGPALAKMFTERVTQSARAIHRDVGGERGLRLEWTPSYEIELVDQRGGRERRRSIEILSGGEQMTAALAVRLALFDVLGRRVGIGIFDEPTNNLDPVRRAQLARLLCGLDERYGQIFVVSHDDCFREHADHVVEAVGEASPLGSLS
ncbi:SMC family ATPase [bacterium]|nr:SMC family ATPase [bacterium]